MPIAISAHRLSKFYPPRRGTPQVHALSDLDLEIEAGTVHGLLGHNGAGKSTAVSILTTLLRPSSGTARVAGHDVATEGDAVRRRIGVVAQQTSIDELLTGRANLLLFGRLRGLNRADATARASDLLSQFDLIDAADRRVSTWSGGMQRRLDLAISLLTRPEVLFVDEPTTGLDPAARRQVWRAIAALAADGTTVLLTTQYLEEADTLAARITILRDGTVASHGTPAELKSRLGGHTVDVTLDDPETAARTAALLGAPLPDLSSPRHSELVVTIPVDHPARDLVRIGSALAEAGIEPGGLTLREPTLDDVFLQITQGAA